jgi:hypothetical protein
LKCILLERSPADRIVVLIFPLMWALYAAPIHDYYRWWSLYWLVIAQFIAAGWEGYAKLIQWVKAKQQRRNPIIDRHLVVIPFPLQRRGADAVRKTPETSGALLTAIGGGGGG